MRLSIDPSSAEPLFDQIARSLRRVISSGVLRQGDRLPPAKELASDLQVNLHTVLRAYALLREEGLLEVRRGRGTVVVSRSPGSSDPQLNRAIISAVNYAHRSGLSEEELLSLVTHAFRSDVGYDRISDE